MAHFNALSTVLVLLQILQSIVSTTSIPISSIDEAQWIRLEQTLSPNASLHGPLSSNSYTSCLAMGTDAYAISDAANGLCMHSHECRYEFCTEGQSYDVLFFIVLLTMISSHCIGVLVDP